MGGDPSVPDIPLGVKPITGNDIFPSRVLATTSPSPVEDCTFYPEGLVDSPPPVASLPHITEDDRRGSTPAERTASLQRVREHDVQTPVTSRERTLGQPASAPLSCSYNPTRQLPVVPHQNLSQDTRTSGRQPLPQPRLHVATAYGLLGLAPGSPDIPQRQPALPHSAAGYDQCPVLPQPSDRQPVPQEQKSWPTSPEKSVYILDPSEIGSIPRPSGLSQKNLRAEMRLDRTTEAKAYYNKIRHVIRGYMSESFWMDWSNVSDDQKNMLFEEVYNDPRIPIIKRYKNDWATDEIAKTIASGRRTTAYTRKEATPNPKYAYNAANSAKRNQTAQRGRWDSVSRSVNHKDKGKRVQHTDARERKFSITLPDHADQSGVDARATNTQSLACTTPGRPQDPGSSQIADPFVYVYFTPDGHCR